MPSIFAQIMELERMEEERKERMDALERENEAIKKRTETIKRNIERTKRENEALKAQVAKLLQGKVAAKPQNIRRKRRRAAPRLRRRPLSRHISSGSPSPNSPTNTH